MISACRQIELSHRRPHQALTFILQLAKLPYLPDAHISIRNNVRCFVPREAGKLNVARRLDSCTDSFG
jgi:hypothetical protein